MTEMIMENAKKWLKFSAIAEKKKASDLQIHHHILHEDGKFATHLHNWLHQMAYEIDSSGDSVMKLIR